MIGARWSQCSLGRRMNRFRRCRWRRHLPAVDVAGDRRSPPAARRRTQEWSSGWVVPHAHAAGPRRYDDLDLLRNMWTGTAISGTLLDMLKASVLRSRTTKPWMEARWCSRAGNAGQESNRLRSEACGQQRYFHFRRLRVAGKRGPAPKQINSPNNQPLAAQNKVIPNIEDQCASGRGLSCSTVASIANVSEYRHAAVPASACTLAPLRPAPESPKIWKCAPHHQRVSKLGTDIL